MRSRELPLVAATAQQNLGFFSERLLRLSGLESKVQARTKSKQKSRLRERSRDYLFWSAQYRVQSIGNR